jgi:hypothetical protein
MRIVELNAGDYIKLKNGSIELKVIEQGRDNKFDYVVIYNDVTDTTTRLVDISDYVKVEK